MASRGCYIRPGRRGDDEAADQQREGTSEASRELRLYNDFSEPCSLSEKER